MSISPHGEYFIDDFKRSIMLRGCNLPAKRPASQFEFYNGVNLSFVGRPWPLNVAEVHAKNLKKLGMNMVRLCIPWEAVMHAGPNEFDEDYLDYLERLIKVFEKEEIYVDLDPHQDVFSRYTGGDGAPKWTFELVGLIPENFHETIAASTEYEFHKKQNKPYPYLLWQTNLSKLACMTMFTLFWAGNTYAPKLQVQNFLQDQYLLFVQKIAERVKNRKNILSIGTMNEISMGYISNTKLDQVSRSVKIGAMPTPLEGFALADGQSLPIQNYLFTKTGFHKKEKCLSNPNKIRAWEKDCVWKLHGVWDYNEEGQPVIIKKEYFQTPHQNTFANEFYKPFAIDFYQKIQSVRSKTTVLLQTQEFIKPPKWDLQKDGNHIIFGRHFYDPIMTAFKWYQNLYNAYEVSRKIIFTKYFIVRAFRLQFASLKKLAQTFIGKVPFLLGETGFVMDLKWGLFCRSGPATTKNDYTYVAKGADRIFQAIEANLMNVAIWNYDIFNTLENGDNWNGENFSIYCGSLKDPFRGKEGWQRPYPQKTPGTPISLSYKMSKRRFYYKFRVDQLIDKPCEIYIPDFLIEKGYFLKTSLGTTEYKNGILLFTPDRAGPKIASIHIQF